jgi:Rtf2 RING-finger
MKTEHCLQCNQSYEPENIITLFPATEADKGRMQNRIDSLSEKGLTHSLKKASGSSKKRNASKITKEQQHSTEVRPEDSDPPIASVSRSQTSTPTPRSATPLSGASMLKASNGIKNASTASLTARVLGEESERKKRRRGGGESENLRSLFTRNDDEKKLHAGDFMTRGFSIPASAKHE